jgi:hypothetical protein
MAWKRQILVVANVTAGSDDLIDLLAQRAEAAETEFTLLCPATRVAGDGTAAARANLEAARERMTGLGLSVTEARVGVADPFEAVLQVYDPREFDEIVVSTLPHESSRWLALDAPRRIQRRTGASVTHLAGSRAKTFC